MAEKDKPDPKPDDDPKTKTFTKAEVEELVEARLKRERAKYSDYDELKAKADAADKVGDKDKGDSERLTEQIGKLTQDLEDERRQRHIVEVAAAKGLTPAHIKRLSGKSREELEASADELLEDFPIPEKADAGADATPPPGGKPREHLKPGNGTPDAGPDPTADLKKLGASMFEGG